VLESMAALPYVEEEGPVAQLTPSMIATIYGHRTLLEVLKYFERSNSTLSSDPGSAPSSASSL